MIRELNFRKMRDSSPHREGRYLVIDAAGVVNVASWSPMWNTFHGWDAIANEPIDNVEWWADTDEIEEVEHADIGRY